MFLDPRQFEFTEILQENAALIQTELLALGEHSYIRPHPLKNVYNFGWDMFGLYAFGKKIEACTALCPETTRVVEMIPGMVGAAFSILRAGAEIDWHFDPKNYSEHIYRCHLGLIVPTDCFFSVGHEMRQWEAGETLLFKGDQAHKAENRSEADRIILIVDVKADLASELEMPHFDPAAWIQPDESLAHSHAGSGI